jgi:hypothetical protein
VTRQRKAPAVNVWAVPLYLAAGELVGAAVLPALVLTGLAGVAGVVAIGSALIAYGTRRTRQPADEEVTEPASR